MRLFDIEIEENFNLKIEFDFQEYDFLFYTEPVCYYDLTNITSRVSSFEQLTYYAEVFLYLNPDVDFNIFFGMFQIMGNREYGKSIRTYSKARIEMMCSEVYKERKKPYCSQWRKIIFNPKIIIRNDEKMSIAGELFKRHISISPTDIEIAVNQIKLAKMEINDSRIADILCCSQKTIQRSMTNAIRSEIKKSNILIRRNSKISKIIEYIDILSEGGNDVKIRELRKLISVKDYSLIKEAFENYRAVL